MSEFGGPMWPYIAEDTLLPAYTPTPNAEPERVVAGDSITFTRSIPQYPAPAWSLKYSMRGVPGTGADFVSQPSGADHQLTVAANVTVNWGVGKYAIQGRAVNAATGETHIIYRSYIHVDPDLAALPNTFDVRAHAEKCLAAIEAVLEGRANDDVKDVEIEGVKIGRMEPEDLHKFRDRYKAEVKALDEQAKIANGLESGRRILTRFVSSGLP